MSSASSSVPSCNVCASDFNKSSNIKIVCFKCDYECCRACAKMYLLSKHESAHCMSCKVEWDRKFLMDNFDNVFMSKTYKQHRENVCFERELGMLQGTQVHVEKQIRVEAIKNELRETKVLIAQLKKKQDDVERALLKEQRTTDLTPKKFVRRCPNGDCLGFLSTALKCELCGVFSCGECRETKGKTEEEKAAHQCKAEVVESIKMIDADSKPCPKCSSLIFKIIGCFAKDTPILMWDQSVKMSQDIIIGDTLIGDDSQMRTVLNTCSGEDDMYEVSQNNGETYVVNSKHTLVLKTTDNQEVEMLVEDYMKLTESKKKLLYGFKSSNGINYPAQDVSLDPYMLGLWLGDGTHTVHRNNTNPFNDQLKKYNLIGNKHIPNEYMMNSREIRLKVLAGLLDTDGSSSNDGKRLSIGQVNKNLANQIFTLAHSLGFVVNKRTQERKNVKCPGVEPKDYKDNHIVSISGLNLSEIPTLLERKKCKDSNANKDYQKTSISIKLIGKGTYYGWQLDGNHRFIGTDFTVLRNCSQMFCICCHTAFDWNTLKIETGVIHNPEYFEYLRRTGTIERNPNEVLCGRELDQNLYIAIGSKMRDEPYDMQMQIQDIIQKCMHIRFYEQPRFRRDRLNDNLDLRIMYMRKQIDKDKFKVMLQKREKEFAKSSEIHNVLAMFINCATEIFYRIHNDPKNINLRELHELRNYTNECLERISNTYKSKQYLITNGFNFE